MGITGRGNRERQLATHSRRTREPAKAPLESPLKNGRFRETQAV
jgi:hypothetical protein